MKKSPLFKNTQGGVGSKFNGRANIDVMYDGDWQKYSKEFLSNNPKCYSCGEKATVTDHIVNHLGDCNIFWKEDNYIPLCGRCHNIITARFDKYHKRGKSIEEKLKWISDNRIRNRIEIRVRVVPIERKKTISRIP